MMKLILFLAVISVAVAQLCDLTPKTELDEVANTMCLFSQPTIIGASVSAGFGTQTGGPATILSKMLNPNSKIDNQAMSGATSIQITRSLEVNDKTSILIGFDLFFWDAVRNECGDTFIENTKNFFKTHQEKNIPMVIGKIPVNAPFPQGVRLAGSRACTREINKIIDHFCKIEKNCLVYDPKDCITAMGSPVSPEGLNYFRDPLHTSTEGNKFCAREFIKTAAFKDLSCSNQ